MDDAENISAIVVIHSSFSKEIAHMEHRNNQAASLRRGLIDQLSRQGAITTMPVEEAFRAVPRHLFLPDTPLQTVYQDTHVISKIRNNIPLSSSSQPSLMANMLELLDTQKGQRILEIGAGTGYNAALLAHLVGETGQVTTVDIDEDIAEEARRHLRTAGYERVQVVCGDGGLGYASAAPYDRIILTTAAADIAPAWFEQLAPGGLLVIPLQLTLLKSRLTIDALVTFERAGNWLKSRSVHASWFLPLRGAFASQQAGYALGPEPGLYLTTRSQVKPASLYASLLATGRDEPTGLRLLQGEASGLYLWLALQSPTFDIAGYDLVNLCATFWTSEQRNEGQREEKILRHYHAALQAYGVNNYAWDELLLDYKMSLIFWLLMPMQDCYGGAHKDYWWPKMQCLVAAFREWHCEDLLV